MNKEEIIKPLSLEETALMEGLKESYFIDSVHYKDEDSEKYFKLLCRLEDFVIQYHELNQRVEKAIEYIILKTTDEDTGRKLGYSDTIDDEYLLEILEDSNE